MLMANCFIVGCEDTKEAVVIDPGGDADKILLSLAESSLKVKYIINTHGHFDHTSANKGMKEATSAPILIHSLDAPMLDNLSAMARMFGVQSDDSPPADQTIDEGDTISFGNITMKVIHTPGHSPGGVTLHAEKNLFVGDTLFAGSIGRTDLPGGNYEDLISNVKAKLFVLGDDVRVFSGHGPETSIGREKRYNPYFR